jgi:hypothetical protein
MARNYILGGMAATQLQAGKPFFKRVVRINGSLGGTDGSGGADRSLASPEEPGRDGLTCTINGGEIRFDGNNGKSKAWNAGPDANAGELLMVEFPTTIRSVQILMEETVVGGTKEAAGAGLVRAKVMLTAPGQDVNAADAANPVIAQPIENGNYIELKQGETATINSRTKVVFILVQRFLNDDVFTGGAGLTIGTPSATTDALSILITGVLDFEPNSGSSQADREPNSVVIPAVGDERSLRKIWGKGDGVG